MCCLILIIAVYACLAQGQLIHNTEPDFELRRIDRIVDIITLNMKKNGWSTILVVGNFPDEFYIKLQNPAYPFAICNLEGEDEELRDVVPYYSNTIVINLMDINEYLSTMSKVMKSPYWHPLANIILYYHQNDTLILAKIFFSLWFYRAVNVIIIQYENDELRISYYTPYTSDDNKFDHLHGCWTTRKVGMPVFNFEQGFFCEAECHNVSLISKLKHHNLGTCIGFKTVAIPYSDSRLIKNLPIFEDKSKNFHGFTFRAYATELAPFLYINECENGSYSLESRDGNIWNAMSKLMNFKIDFTPSLPGIKGPFSFEQTINELFDLAFRRVDFAIGPVYLYDLAVVEVDYSFPYKDSGACIISVRAGFDTTLFEAKTLQAHQNVIIQFILCFLSIWLIFSVYQVVEKEQISFDQIGKDLLNAFRNILLISLYNPPKQHTFRIFLTISIWSFFVLNFATQATIVSYLTAAQRGKDVDTFEEMISKGYPIYGMASPDIILPDTEERFNIINSRLIPIQNPMECIKNLSYDAERFCLVDCSIARYLARNMLNEKGEQYLHIAQQDKMHSNHLTLLLHKRSPLTKRFDKYLMKFLEAGLISKWERYRYTVMKEEAPVKPLGMIDLKNLFYVFCIFVVITFTVFILELIIYAIKSILKLWLR